MKKMLLLFGLVLSFYGSLQTFAVDPAPEICFQFKDGVITKYYEYLGGAHSGTPCPVNVLIPSTINGIPVTRIGDSAFKGSGERAEEHYLKTVKLPDTLEYIDIWAFQYNKLTHIDFPTGLKKIGQGAFSNNQLQYVALPENLEELAEWSFQFNAITGVVFPKNLSKISYGTFYKNQITGTLEIPDTVKIIETAAFSENRISKLKLPSALEVLGDWAFNSNLLTTIDLPDTLRSIGKEAFAWNQFSTVRLPSRVDVLLSGFVGQSWPGKNPVTAYRSHCANLSEEKKAELATKGLLCPEIKISVSPETIAKEKTLMVEASDIVSSGFFMIPNGSECGSTLPYTYTFSSPLALSENHNGKKACLRLAYSEEDVIYVASPLIEGIDSSKPLIGNVEVELRDKDVNKPYFTFTGVDQGVAGLKEWIITIDDKEPVRLPATTTEYLPHGLSGTHHTVKFQLVDEVGNVSEEKIIRFPPAVTIKAPFTQSSGAIADIEILIDGPVGMKIKKIDIPSINPSALVCDPSLPSDTNLVEVPIRCQLSSIASSISLDISVIADGDLRGEAHQQFIVDEYKPTLQVISFLSDNSSLGVGAGAYTTSGSVVKVLFDISDHGGSYPKPLAECSLNGTDWASCSSPYVFPSDDGHYELKVRAKDAVGLMSDIQTFVLDKDTTPPIVDIHNPDATPASRKTVSASTNEGSLSYAIISKDEPCDIGHTYIPGNQVVFSSPMDNGQRVCFRAVDELGNESFSRSEVIEGIEEQKPEPSLPQSSSSGYSGGGGRALVMKKDSCPHGDASPSYYDGTCSAVQKEEKSDPQTLSFSDDELYNPSVEDGYCYARKKDVSITDSLRLITSEEFKKALSFLYGYEMTKFSAIDDFDPYRYLSRQEAAKIFSQFAMHVLCRKPDSSLSVQYTDIDNADPSLKPYITLAYQLGLMKGSGQGDGLFRPYEFISKAEFNATLMRMILKSYLPETGVLWYESYNQVATDLKIITQGAGLEPVSRNHIALMLFRAYKEQVFSLQHIDYESFVLKDRALYVK